MNDRVYRTWMLIMGALAVAFYIYAIFGAHAADRGEWFKSLQVPGTGYSCCDVADCHKTNAKFVGGHWYAAVPAPDGPATEVPPDKVLRRPISIDGDAYICTNNNWIRCFIPPWMPM